MGKVIAICTSPARGTQKKPVPSARFTVDWGIEGDAHGGRWHRQVSLLSADKIEAFTPGAPTCSPGLLEKTWWLRDLISGPFQWAHCCAAAACCWR